MTIKQNVAFKDKYFLSYENKLKTINDVYDGIDNLTNEDYLIKNEFETKAAYEIRLKRAELFNHLRNTVLFMKNMLFRKDIKINYASKYKKLFDNIDGKGSTLSQFTQELSKRTILDGMSYIWVDSARTGNISLYDKDKLGINPSLNIIKRQDLINKRIENVNGSMILTQATIVQSREVFINDFESQEQTIYIVLKIGGGKVYIKNKKEEGSYDLVDEWTNNIPFIPLIPVYAEKTGLFQSEIPFYDLAVLNIGHFNKQSGLINILNISCSPVPVFFKVDEGISLDDEENEKSTIAIGPNTAMIFSDKEKEGFEYKEIQGIGIEQIGKDLIRTEERMDKMTLSMLYKDGASTATEAKLREGRNNLFLVEIANSIEFGINKAVEIAQLFSGDNYSFSFSMNRDFLDAELDANMVDKLLQMKLQGIISRETLWDVLIKGDVLQYFDYSKEAEKIKTEEAEILPTDNLIG